jgi:hypothetical protein
VPDAGCQERDKKAHSGKLAAANRPLASKGGNYSTPLLNEVVKKRLFPSIPCWHKIGKTRVDKIDRNR